MILPKIISSENSSKLGKQKMEGSVKSSEKDSNGNLHAKAPDTAKDEQIETNLNLVSSAACSKIFPKEDNLSTHQIGTGEKPFFCDVCGEGFAQKNDLSNHYRTHTNEKSFSCEASMIFLKIISSEDSSKLGKQNMDGSVKSSEKDSNGNLCAKAPDTAKDEQIKTNLNLVSSAACSKIFPKEDNLSTHQIGTGEKPFFCDVCGKDFAQKNHLSNHYLTHTNEKPFSCDLCGRAFFYQEAFKKHFRNHAPKKVYSCNMCGKDFYRKKQLYAHYRTHTDEKPFSCDLCGKGFSHKGHFNTHYRYHTKEKPFSCDVCGKDFYSTADLSKHYRTHTKEKPYLCDVCGQDFSRKDCLNRHYRIHTNVKSFSCDICGKDFFNKDGLNKHLRTHTNEKPFSSDVNVQLL